MLFWAICMHFLRCLLVAFSTANIVPPDVDVVVKLSPGHNNVLQSLFELCEASDSRELKKALYGFLKALSGDTYGRAPDR